MAEVLYVNSEQDFDYLQNAAKTGVFSASCRSVHGPEVTSEREASQRHTLSEVTYIFFAKNHNFCKYLHITIIEASG